MVVFQIDKDSPVPLHMQLLGELRRLALSRELKPGMRLPSEPELMEALAISRTTIRQAWQAAEAEGLIYRVHGKGTYVAELSNIRPARLIGFMIPNFRSTFDSQLLIGADNYLREFGYRLTFAHTNRDVAVENQLLGEMLAEGIAGFLLWPAWTKDKTPRFLDGRRDVATVFMDRPIPDLDYPCVATQHYVGTREAIRFLVTLGHSAIAFVARPHLELWSIGERFRGYQDEMVASNLTPCLPILVGEATELGTRHAQQSYAEARGQEIAQLRIILSQPEHPTAIFAMNDLMALQVLRAASLAGLKVPEDLSLVGFDDLEMVSHVIPPLTTVAQDPFKIGAEAARCLLDMLNGEAPARRLISVPSHLIIRESTMKPAEVRRR